MNNYIYILILFVLPVFVAFGIEPWCKECCNLRKWFAQVCKVVKSSAVVNSGDKKKLLFGVLRMEDTIEVWSGDH